jgi:hypothetical protein
VERVLGFKTGPDGLKLHIQWKGYPEEDATWEAAALLSTITVVKEYCASHGLSLDARAARRARRANAGGPE